MNAAKKDTIRIMNNRNSQSPHSPARRGRKAAHLMNLTLPLALALLLAAALGACAQKPAPQGAKQYDAPPPMTINPDKEYLAQVVMAEGGQFTIALYPAKAPLTVNSFVFLAREGFFDGVTFHRVIDGFMAQGGDPSGTGGGGPGYTFANEDSDLTFDRAGVVAMANAGRNTNGSQFFITFAPAEFLNGDYTIFGQVIEGMEVVNAITRRDPQQNPAFTGDAIQTVTIIER